MGIIQTQAVRGTIYSYLGVGIGFIVNLLIYPKIFETNQIGLLRILVAYAALFAQFASFGFPRVTTVIFPYFRDYEKKHHGFFFIAFVVSTIGLFVSLILLLILKPAILGEGVEKSALFTNYFYYLIPLIVASLYYIVFDNYYKVLYNSVQGIFLKEFLQRVLILGIAFLFIFEIVDFAQFVLLYVLAYVVPAAVLLVLLIIDKQLFVKPEFNFLTSDLKKRMFNVGFYGILTSFSGILVLNIDSIMINAMIDLSSTGIYAITFYFGTVILIPSRPLLKISSVIIADAWKNKNMAEINKIYYKSCLNQLIFASLLFIGIWGNVHNYFNEYLLQPVFEPGKYVILFISLASLFQMAGGTSNMILFTSPKYKTHTYLMLALVVLLICTNLVLIPLWGIVGAAAASALSFLLFNVIKYLYLNKTFGFKPYDARTVYVILFAGATYALNLLIPKFDFFITDIVIRSSFMLVVYVSLILISGVSEEVNKKFDEVLNKMRIKK